MVRWFLSEVIEQEYAPGEKSWRPRIAKIGGSLDGLQWSAVYDAPSPPYTLALVRVECDASLVLDAKELRTKDKFRAFCRSNPWAKHIFHDQPAFKAVKHDG